MRLKMDLPWMNLSLRRVGQISSEEAWWKWELRIELRMRHRLSGRIPCAGGIRRMGWVDHVTQLESARIVLKLSDIWR